MKTIIYIFITIFLFGLISTIFSKSNNQQKTISSLPRVETFDAANCYDTGISKATYTSSNKKLENIIKSEIESPTTYEYGRTWKWQEEAGNMVAIEYYRYDKATGKTQEIVCAELGTNNEILRHKRILSRRWND